MMNGISRGALVGLLGVALGAIVSLIGVWVEGRREARRIADQRRYERVRDRIDKLEPHIVQLHLASTEVKTTAEALLDVMVEMARSGKQEMWFAEMLRQYVKELEQALEKARALLKEGPAIIVGSLEPQILDGLNALYLSLSSLRVLCSIHLFETDEVFASHDLESTEAWAEKWRGQILTGHERFSAAHKKLVLRLGNLLEDRYPRPSWLRRLREWRGRRRG